MSHFKWASCEIEQDIKAEIDKKDEMFICYLFNLEFPDRLFTYYYYAYVMMHIHCLIFDIFLFLFIFSYSETLLIFFAPQVLNFLLSLPQVRPNLSLENVTNWNACSIRCI